MMAKEDNAQDKKDFNELKVSINYFVGSLGIVVDLLNPANKIKVSNKFILEELHAIHEGLNSLVMWSEEKKEDVK